MLFLVHAIGSLHVEKECELQRARLVFKQLFDSALPAEESKSLIGRVVQEVGTVYARGSSTDSVALASASWRSGSCTGSGSGNACAEVAFLEPVVAVREGPALVVSPGAWASFVQGLDE